MKKVLEEMVIHWHECGYSVNEIHDILPQLSMEQIASVIQYSAIRPHGSNHVH